jgi:hypothetical protein
LRYAQSKEIIIKSRYDDLQYTCTCSRSSENICNSSGGAQESLKEIFIKSRYDDYSTVPVVHVVGTVKIYVTVVEVLRRT